MVRVDAVWYTGGYSMVYGWMQYGIDHKNAI
jgi:hypothetical protein